MLKPLKNNVFVTDLDFGMKMSRGIIVMNDDMKDRGIHPRWAKVYAIGPDIDDLTVGSWIYIEHGRWTNGIDIDDNGETKKVWRVEYPKSVLLVSDEDPRTEEFKF